MDRYKIANGIIALLYLCQLFAFSLSTFSVSLSPKIVRLGGSFQIAVNFDSTGFQRSIKCGYQGGSSSFVAFAEYTYPTSAFQLITTGSPHIFTGRISVADAKTIRISQAKFEDENVKFYCAKRQGWWLIDKGIVNTSHGLVTVYATPRFGKTSLPDISTVLEKKTLTLNCTVISKPASNISWSFRHDINASQRQRVSQHGIYYSSVTSTLTISNITPSLNGTKIKCIGKPRYGTPILQLTRLIVTCTYSCETWNGGCNYICSKNSTSVQNSCAKDQVPTTNIIERSNKTGATCRIVRSCGINNSIIYQPNTIKSCPCLTGYVGKPCNIYSHECRKYPCGINGKCLTDFKICACFDGFTGRHCSINIDECLNNTRCMNNATCIDGINAYTCQCLDGFTGRHCSVNIDECLNNTKCMNNATCIDGINAYTCQCLDGFSGRHCSVNIDECLNNTKCMNNATCIDGINSYKCQCLDGFTGRHCSVNIDECFNNTKCMNHATCIDGINSYTCQCLDGFTGRHCSVNIDECLNNTKCMNNATCIDRINAYTCQCLDGFAGRHCSVNIDECLNNTKCMNNATCIDRINAYTCQCLDGFAGRHCSVNIDECLNNTKCMNNATCIDGINAYTCQCLDGFTGRHCEKKFDQCFHNRCQNGICIGNMASFTCKCYAGYTGRFCETDIDECRYQAKNICNHGICIPGNNTFYCQCNDGFSNSRCETDQSSCRSSPCNNGGTCIASSSTGVGFVCKCQGGFAGLRCEKKFKPCDAEPCGNKAACTNVDKNGQLIFKCNCAKGYGGDTCQYFYGNTAVSVILKPQKSKKFNETMFKIAIARSLNDFCSKSPEACLQLAVNTSTKHERFRRSQTKPYVYTSRDVKFIPGYPKMNTNGRVVVRFFVTFETSSSSQRNSTSSPAYMAVVNPKTVKKALDGNTVTSSYGFDIETVEIVQTTDAYIANNSESTKTLVIVTVIFTILFVVFVIAAVYLLWHRYQRLSSLEEMKNESNNAEIDSSESGKLKSKINWAYDREAARKTHRGMKSAGKIDQENMAKGKEFINMISFLEDKTLSPSYVNVEKNKDERRVENNQYVNIERHQDESGVNNQYVNIKRNKDERTLKINQYVNMDSVFEEGIPGPLYEIMDANESESDYLQPVIIAEDLYLKIVPNEDDN